MSRQRPRVSARALLLRDKGISPNRICSCCGCGPNDGCNPSDCLLCWPCVPLADIDESA